MLVGRMNTFVKNYRDTGIEPVVNLFVCSLVDSEWQAINIVDRFRTSGFSSGDLSVLVPSRSPVEPTPVDEDGVVISVLDTAFEWLGGLTSFHLPAVGLLRGAGPILGTFTGWNQFDIEDMATPLQSFGMSPHRAEYYAERLAAGEMLLAVHSSELRWAKRAEQIFSRMGARDINYSGSLAVCPQPEERIVTQTNFAAPLAVPPLAAAGYSAPTPVVGRPRFTVNARPEIAVR